MAELVDLAELQSLPRPTDQDDDNALKFLDSLDSYMSLLGSLSSTLGQGLFQLASARHSMGATRINSAVLSLKPHNAATRLQVAHDHDQLQFTLCKWTSSVDGDSKETEDDGDLPKAFEKLTTEDEDASSSPEPQEKSSPTNSPALDAEQQVQKERLKSLAVFGALAPPRLRDSQLTFEKTLEIIIEIANARSSMLQAFGKLQKDTKK